MIRVVLMRQNCGVAEICEFVVIVFTCVLNIVIADSAQSITVLKDSFRVVVFT